MFKNDELGFGTKPQDTRVVVGMSGGVDSSVTAALLVEAGYDVVGITLQLYDHGSLIQKKGACCAGRDIYDARAVCDQLGIPHYVLDYESRFKKNVIDDFANTYIAGETPIPCIRCNQRVKFKDLLDTSRDLGAKALITGHYAKRLMGPDGAELHRGDDPRRDQSYFLFTTTQGQLDYLRFPLGDVEKTETRKIAERFNLKTAAKPDSQDICFVPNGTYARVIEKLRPGTIEPGEIRHLNGRVLGTHDGIIHYTIGQRKGLGIGGGDPLYVIKLDPTTHEVIVGPKEALGVRTLRLKETNWLASNLEGPVMVKVRSTQPPIPATIEVEGTEARVILQDLEYGISPGQACVAYDGSRVLGGGWVVEAS